MIEKRNAPGRNRQLLLLRHPRGRVDHLPRLAPLRARAPLRERRPLLPPALLVGPAASVAAASPDPLLGRRLRRRVAASPRRLPRRRRSALDLAQRAAFVDGLLRRGMVRRVRLALEWRYGFIVF